ncbi:hypothetical protein JTB14_014076 [Gonioctena quinquepunctata]|nr:hypothetical protein JTB14_014076 [Gonioctena quinquepunctata]
MLVAVLSVLCLVLGSARSQGNPTEKPNGAGDAPGNPGHGTSGDAPGNRTEATTENVTNKPEPPPTNVPEIPTPKAPEPTPKHGTPTEQTPAKETGDPRNSTNAKVDSETPAPQKADGKGKGGASAVFANVGLFILGASILLRI